MAKPLLNGEYYSWSDIKLRITGTDFVFKTSDFVALGWSDTLERGKVRGEGQGARGRTKGEYQAEGSMTLTLAAAMAFQKALKGIDDRVGLVPFDVNISFVADDSDPDKVTDVRLAGCSLAGRTNAAAPGSDGQVKEMPLDVMRIYEDGICLIGDN